MTIQGPTIKLANGAYWDLTRPEESAELVDFRTIALALSNLCRFTGHTRSFYSVAEHSIVCSLFAPPGLEWAALCHDAAEAFLGDVSSPLKALLPDYKALERRTEHALFRRLGVWYPLDPLVKEIDLRMLRTEQEQLWDDFQAWQITEGVEPYPWRLRCWTPALAFQTFHSYFKMLQQLGLVPGCVQW